MDYMCGERLSTFLMPLAAFTAIFLFGLWLRKFLFVRLARWAQKTETHLDDIIIASTKEPFIIWCVMFGIYCALNVSCLPQNIVHIFGKALFILGVISVTLVLANISTKFIKSYSDKTAAALPVTSLTENAARIVLFGVGVLIILNSLGISIAPILATLGVGGLAVALALQDTLSNLFAGFHIVAARQIKVGDYIKLESGEEGYVADITLRTTKIRMLPNNVVLVPNMKLTQAIIINYYLPDKEMAVLVDVSVHYNSDLSKVEEITCRAAEDTMKKVAGGVPEFKPFIRYNKLGDSGIGFTVILRAMEFTDQYLIKHEFIKILHERYNKEGIVIPYPIRAVNYEQEKPKV